MDSPDASASPTRGRGRRSGRGRARTTGPRRLDGRVVVLTGASSGIGADAARALARRGATVALVARRVDELTAVADEIAAGGDGAASVHPCDLTDLEATRAVAAEILAAHGRVDVLVNNAGRSIRRGIDQSYDRMHDFERTMQINYLGAVQLTLAFLPGMRERRRGHIVNLSSIAVQGKFPRFASYVASKAALDAFSACVGSEVRHEGVTFTTVHMPLVRTPMIEPTKLYEHAPAISSERAAAMVVDAVLNRPRSMGSRAGDLVAIGNRVAPRSMLRARNAAYRVLPD